MARLKKNFVFEAKNLFFPSLFQGDFKSQKEAAWAVTNLTSGGTVQQLAQLVQLGVLEPFCNLLLAKDWKTVIVVLDGLTNILNTAEKMGEVDRVAMMIEEVQGLDKLEALQHHENEEVYLKAVSMIDTFFSEGVNFNDHQCNNYKIFFFSINVQNLKKNLKLRKIQRFVNLRRESLC